MKNILWLISSLCVIAFMTFAPAYLDTQLERDIFMEYLKGNPREWEGVIKVWNIYDNEANCSEILKKSIKDFEKKNKGIYIELLTLTSEQAAQRIEKNYEPADIWVFPQGKLADKQKDYAFSLPAPSEDKVLKSDFEFEIDEEDKKEEKRYIQFCISISAEDFYKAENAHKLAMFIAQSALDMVE